MKRKCGICEWSLAVTGPSAIEYAGKIGFDGIQLGDLGGAKNCFPMNDPNIQMTYLEAAKRWKVEIPSMHLFTLVREGGLQREPDSAEGRRALLSIEKGLDACAVMKIPALLVTSYDACAIVNERDMECTARMLKRACAMAEDKGVRLTYESILQGEYVGWILDEVGPQLTLCYDILNPIKFLKGDPAKEIKTFGRGRIDHVHLKDTPEDMTGFCQLGSGRGRFFESMGVLNEIGFDGWYITENFYHLPPMGNTGSVFETAKKDLRIMRGEEKK